MSLTLIGTFRNKTLENFRLRLESEEEMKNGGKEFVIPHSVNICFNAVLELKMKE